MHLEFSPGRASGSPNAFVSSLSDWLFSRSIYWAKGSKRNLFKAFSHIASTGEGSYGSHLTCLVPDQPPKTVGRLAEFNECQLENFSSVVHRDSTDPWKLYCSKWGSQASSMGSSTNSRALQKCCISGPTQNQNLHFNEIFSDLSHTLKVLGVLQREPDMLSMCRDTCLRKYGWRITDLSCLCDNHSLWQSF